MGTTEIYYFSGTGNSFHVAKELRKRIPEAKLIPILKGLEEDIIKTKGSTVGFVFPIYVSSVPAVVKKILKKFDFSSAQYIFAIATRGGTLSVANFYLQRLLKKQGKRLNLYVNLNMALNSPTGIMPGFLPSEKDWADQITEEKISHLEADVQNSLEGIAKMIMNQEESAHSRRLDKAHLMSILMRPAEYISEHSVTEIPFYADSQCRGCGICEKVCLSKKIKMMDGKPVWQKSVGCYYCYACFNFCPMQSILVNNSKNSYTAKNARYVHPDSTANEIAGQKR